MTTAEKRTYLVIDTMTGNGRLVKTNSQTRAATYVIGARYKVRTATQDDIIIALQAGVPVEELDAEGKIMSPGIPARRADDVKISPIDGVQVEQTGGSVAGAAA